MSTLCHSGDGPRIGIDGRFIQDKFHGIGPYVYGLITAVCQHEGDHRVVAFVDPALPNSRFALDTLRHLPRLELCPIALPLYHPLEVWGWSAYLRRFPVDVFHAPYFWSPLRLPCPLVTTVHDMIFDRYPQYMPLRRFAMVYKATSRYAIRKARRVIAISEATKRDIIHYTGAPADKIAVIPRSPDATFRPIETEDLRRVVRERYGLTAGYVLAVGARRPHKNIGRLITAFSRIAGQVPQVLVLVGTLDERFPLEQPGELDRLRSAGKIVEIAHVAQEDLPVMYSMADLFVQPSIIEGFGLPVLEAMACGCPVACSNTSSLPEVAGNAALYFDPLSVDDIARRLIKALTSSELRHGLSERGLRHARRFNWETEASMTLGVYRQATEVSP